MLYYIVKLLNLYVLCTYLCYYLSSSAHMRVRAQKRVIIAGNVIIIRYFVVSKDCSRLLILLRLVRQYYIGFIQPVR